MRLLLSTLILLFVFSFTGFTQTERAAGIELYNKGEYRQAIEKLDKIVDVDHMDRDRGSSPQSHRGHGARDKLHLLTKSSFLDKITGFNQKTRTFHPLSVPVCLRFAF